MSSSMQTVEQLCQFQLFLKLQAQSIETMQYKIDLRIKKKNHSVLHLCSLFLHIIDALNQLQSQTIHAEHPVFYSTNSSVAKMFSKIHVGKGTSILRNIIEI